MVGPGRFQIYLFCLFGPSVMRGRPLRVQVQCNAGVPISINNSVVQHDIVSNKVEGGLIIKQMCMKSSTFRVVE